MPKLKSRGQWWFQVAVFLFAGVALFVSIYALIYARDMRSDVENLQQDAGSRESQALVQDVRDDFGALMDAMQAVGVLFGVIAAGAALFGFSSFSQINERVEEMDGLLDETKKTKDEVDRKVTELKEVEQDIIQTREQTRKASFALAATQLAQYQLGLGNDRVARDQLQLAHEQDPQNETIAFLLGDIMSRQEDFLRAEAILRDKAHAEAEIDGRYAKPWAAGTYAYVLRLVGSNLPEQRDDYWKKSNTIFERLWADEDQRSLLDTHGESVFGAWGGLLYRQGHLEKAIEKYRHAAKVTLRNSYPINNLGLIYFDLHQLVESQRWFWISRRKALGKFLTNSDDYYAVFDVMTARLAIKAMLAEDPQLQVQSYRLADFESAIMPANDSLLDEVAASMEVPKPLNQLAEGLTRLLKPDWFQNSSNVEDVRDEIMNLQQRAREYANK